MDLFKNRQFSFLYFNSLYAPHGKMILNFRQPVPMIIRKRKKICLDYCIPHYSKIILLFFKSQPLEETNQFFLQLSLVYFLCKRYPAMGIHRVLSKKPRWQPQYLGGILDNAHKNRLRCDCTVMAAILTFLTEQEETSVPCCSYIPNFWLSKISFLTFQQQ